ncbi:uncharacterized protein LOC118437951 [Folsomia candida]|uniref:uncharacterized protein LOC118437951 n=1 Tax=Folsomia candida TaxID=158441 RepID=UPI001604D221|nr:uncharacterized protein LOC118437951 [Folsomia candida]
MIPPGDNNNSGNGDAQIARHRKRNRDALVLVFYVSFLMGMSLSERVNMNKTWRNELERIKEKQSLNFTREFVISSKSSTLLLNTTTRTEWRKLSDHDGIQRGEEFRQFIKSIIKSMDTNLNTIRNRTFHHAPLSPAPMRNSTLSVDEDVKIILCKGSIDTDKTQNSDQPSHSNITARFPLVTDNWTQFVNETSGTQEFSILDQFFYNYAPPFFLILGAMTTLLFGHFQWRVTWDIAWASNDMRTRLDNPDPPSEYTHRFVETIQRYIQKRQRIWVLEGTLVYFLMILIAHLVVIYMLKNNNVIDGIGKFDQGWKFKGEFYVPLDDERFLEFKTTTNLNWKFVNDYEDAKCSMKIDWVNEVKFIELFALAIGMG